MTSIIKFWGYTEDARSIDLIRFLRSEAGLPIGKAKGVVDAILALPVVQLSCKVSPARVAEQLAFMGMLCIIRNGRIFVTGASPAIDPDDVRMTLEESACDGVDALLQRLRIEPVMAQINWGGELPEFVRRVEAMGFSCTVDPADAAHSKGA